MKSLARKLIAVKLIFGVFLMTPLYLRAQQTGKLMGELVVTKITADGFVTINGERAESGRAVAPTSEIATSEQASARVLLPQTGTILVAPATRLNLSFVGGSISGDLISGEITVETAPNTTLNFLTPDGAIMLPNTATVNVVKLTVAGGKTRIHTLTGQVSFNNVKVAAGEFYPAADADNTAAPTANTSSKRGVNPLLILGILGAVGAVAVIALSSHSSGNTDTPVLSPVR